MTPRKNRRGDLPVASYSDDLPDFVLGRLSGRDLRTIEAHVRGCDRCSATLRWLLELRQEALEQGYRHISAARIVELGEGRPGAVAAERLHLERCPECEREIRWAGALADPGILSG